MQITKSGAFISALDISLPHVTWAAIRIAGPFVAYQDPVGARPDRCGQPRTRSPPVLPRYSRQVPARGAGRAAPRDPAGCATRRSAGGIDRDGTVTPATPRSGGRRRRPGVPCRIVSPIPVAHRVPLSGRRPRGGTASFTSSSCARRAPLRSSGRGSGPRRPCSRPAAQEYGGAAVARVRTGCTAFLPSAPASGDTSVVTRLPSARRGAEPRMNGRAGEEVRGCTAVTA